MREAVSKTSRSKHRTQWAAQFAVASELCKRGYEVALTMGYTTPDADLMVVSPKKNNMFLVDVKGQYKRNGWGIKRKQKRKQLFYILAFVPDGEPNEFFILTQQDINAYIDDNFTRFKWAEDRKTTGITKEQAEKHRNKWSSLPQ